MNIRINDETNEKLKEIKNNYDLKNIDEAINLAIKNTPSPQGYTNEPPVFILGEKKVISWTDLKNSELGDEWSVDNEIATVIFKDDYGVLIRFKNTDSELDFYDTYIEYYNFI